MQELPLAILAHFSTSIHGDVLVASTAASCKKHSPATKSLTLQTFLLNEKRGCPKRNGQPYYFKFTREFQSAKI
jgi:hypothetical protein